VVPVGQAFHVRYIDAMFEVLVFVYENYWRGDACPQNEQLQRKLSAVGFETDEIHEALAWLGGLNQATRNTQLAGAANSAVRPSAEPLGESMESMRVYSVQEQNVLGPQCLGFINFLESAGVLPSHMREVVVDRAMASHAEPLGLDDLKIIILMVYWSYGEEPDALVLDELCDDSSDRLGH
jgi:Smg protein